MTAAAAALLPVHAAASTVRVPVPRPALHPGAGATLRDVTCAVQDTSVGRMLFAVRDGGEVVAVLFVPDAAALRAALGRLAVLGPVRVADDLRTAVVRSQVADYLAGRRRRFDLRIDLALASPFQRAVLTDLQSVPYGRRSSYGELATAAGRPAAARAVGTALATNPLCVVLPCHRIVAASGALSGYAGGTSAKQSLLRLEAGRR